MSFSKFVATRRKSRHWKNPFYRFLIGSVYSLPVCLFFIVYPIIVYGSIRMQDIVIYAMFSIIFSLVFSFKNRI